MLSLLKRHGKMDSAGAATDCFEAMHEHQKKSVWLSTFCVCSVRDLGVAHSETGVNWRSRGLEWEGKRFLNHTCTTGMNDNVSDRTSCLAYSGTCN